MRDLDVESFAKRAIASIDSQAHEQLKLRRVQEKTLRAGLAVVAERISRILICTNGEKRRETEDPLDFLTDLESEAEQNSCLTPEVSELIAHYRRCLREISVLETICQKANSRKRPKGSYYLGEFKVVQPISAAAASVASDRDSEETAKTVDDSSEVPGAAAESAGAPGAAAAPRDSQAAGEGGAAQETPAPALSEREGQPPMSKTRAEQVKEFGLKELLMTGRIDEAQGKRCPLEIAVSVFGALLKEIADDPEKSNKNILLAIKIFSAFHNSADIRGFRIAFTAALLRIKRAQGRGEQNFPQGLITVLKEEFPMLASPLPGFRAIN